MVAAPTCFIPHLFFFFHLTSYGGVGSFRRVTAANELLPPRLSVTHLCCLTGCKSRLALRDSPSRPRCSPAAAYRHSFIFCAIVCLHAFLSRFLHFSPSLQFHKLSSPLPTQPFSPSSLFFITPLRSLPRSLHPSILPTV